MKWLNIFQRRGSADSSPASSFDFDKKLIKNVSRRIIPRFSQIKYLSRFLNAAERKFIAILLVISIITGLMAGSIFIFDKTQFVPKEGGSYSEAMVGQPQYINPLFSSSSDIDSDIVALVYSGLFSYNKKQLLTPDLAERYTVSSDKKIYDITLKPNVRWSDGEPFTANDILFTFETIQNNEVGSSLFPTFQGVQIEKIDDLRIRFTLKEPFAPFLNTLTVGIIPEHIWSSYTEGSLTNLRLAEQNLKPVGTGPWKFDKFVKKDDGSIQAYFLTKNEHYYGQKPYFKTLSFEFFEDCNQAVQAVQKEHIRAMSFVSCKQKNELEKKHVALHDITLPQYTALFFNQDNNTLLKDKNMRLALGQAIRKEDIVTQALHESGSIINGPLLEGSLGYHKDIKVIPFAIDDANTLLDKKWTRIQPEEYFNIRKTALQKQFRDTMRAQTSSTTSSPTLSEGLESTITETIRGEMPPSQTFYRKDKTNNLLQLAITTVEIPEYQAVAELVKKQWQALGIQTSITVVRKADIKKEILRGHNYDILLYGEIVGADSDLFPFWHSSQIDAPGLNLALFSNRNADKILEEARIATDTQKRDGLYKQFQDILAEEIPAIFLYTPTYTFMINKDIKGVQISHLTSPADRFMFLADWYEKTAWKWR